MVSVFAKRTMIIGIIGATIIIILYSSGGSVKCQINQIDILNDLKRYEKTHDPGFCDSINDRIIQLNNQCGLEMEVLDCG